MNDQPLLKNEDTPVVPADGKCCVCSGSFDRGIAYLSAGALLMDKSGENSIPTDKLRAFFNIGWHGATKDKSVDVEIVSNLAGGQFDIQFCSQRCMSKWFEEVLAQLPPDHEPP